LATCAGVSKDHKIKAQPLASPKPKGASDAKAVDTAKTQGVATDPSNPTATTAAGTATTAPETAAAANESASDQPATKMEVDLLSEVEAKAAVQKPGVDPAVAQLEAEVADNLLK